MNGFNGEAFVGKIGDGGGGLFLVPAEDEHPGTGTGQRTHEGATQRTVATGDDGYFVLHIFIIHICL